MRFLDTMSIHIATHGFTSMQRVVYNAKKNGRNVFKAVKEKQNANNYFKDSRDFQVFVDQTLSICDFVHYRM